MNTAISNILRFSIVIVLQIFVCSVIDLFGFVSPALYLLALLLLPLELPKSVQYIIGFCTGLLIDMFAHTLGVNAAASLVVMFVRPYIVRLLNGRNSVEGVDRPIPGVKDFKWILVYVLTLSFIHQFLVVMLETSSFHNFGHTMLSVLCYTTFTAFVLLCVEYIFFPVKRT